MTHRRVAVFSSIESVKFWQGAKKMAWPSCEQVLKCTLNTINNSRNNIEKKFYLARKQVKSVYDSRMFAYKPRVVCTFNRDTGCFVI